MDCEDEKTEFFEVDGEKSVMDPEMKRRSSILKPQKPRNPFSTLDFSEPNPDTTLAKAARRVSFASSNFVKPFAADPEKNTIWDNTYEEEVNHTDSTKSSCEQTQETKSVDFLNTTSIYTEADETTSVRVIHAKTATSTLKYISLDKENVNPILSDYDEVEFTVNGNKTTCSEQFMELTATNISARIQRGPVQNFEQTVGQCDMELTSMFSVELKERFQEEADASEPDLDQKHALKRKTIYFSESKAQMDITTASPIQKRKKAGGLRPDQIWVNPLLEKKDNVNTEISFDQVEDNIEKRRETIHFDSSDGDMDITAPLPGNVNENDKASKRNTIHFNELAAEMSFTSTLPSADIKEKVFEAKSNTEFADANQTRRNFNQTCADMSLTTILPSAEIIKENIVKSKECKAFSDADMSFTVGLPSAQIIREKSAEYQKHTLPTFKETTLHFDQTGGVDMSFTSILPTSDVIREKLEASEKDPVHFGSGDNEQISHFNQTGVDMSFTTVLPSAEAIRENILRTESDEKEDFGNLRSKRTTQLNQTSADMSLTSILPNPEVLRQKVGNTDNEPVATQINQTGVDMSFTGTLPSAEVIKEKSVSSKREMVHFSGDDKRFAPKLPCKESDGPLNRKTMLFNQTEDDMSFTTPLPHAQVITEKINGSKREIQHFSEPDYMQFASNESDGQLKRKTTFFNQMDKDGSLTAPLPNAHITAEKLNGSKREIPHFSEPDFMQFAPHLPPNESGEQVNRKTLIFNQVDGDMSFTTPLPHAQVITEKINGSKRKIQHFSEPDFMQFAPHLPPNESDGQLNLKTIVFNHTNGDMSLTTPLPNAQVNAEKIQNFNEPDYVQFVPNENDGRLNRKTIFFNQMDGDISPTKILPNVEEMKRSKTETKHFHKHADDSKEVPTSSAATRTTYNQIAANISLTTPLPSAEDIEKSMDVIETDCNVSERNMESTAALLVDNIANNTRSKLKAITLPPEKENNLDFSGTTKTVDDNVKIHNGEHKTSMQLSTLSSSNILYSEPMKIRLKAHNFTPIPDLSANLHLHSLDGSLNLKLAPVSTPATSFHMNLTTMSPCIEDTQQLIYATFSRPESLNVSLSNKENAPLEVRTGGLDEEQNVYQNMEVTEALGTLSLNNEGNIPAAPSVVSDIRENFAPYDAKTNERTFVKGVPAVNEKTYIKKEAKESERMNNSEEDFLKINDSFQSHVPNLERSCYLEDITPLDLAPNDSNLSLPDYSPKQSNEDSELTGNDSNLSQGDSISSDYNNYTLRSQLVLANIERYSTKYRIDRSEDVLDRAVALLREFERTTSAIKETIHNFRMPKLDIVDLEQKHEQVMEKQLKTVHKAGVNVEEEKNAPSMAGLDVPKSLYERICEKGERYKKHWKLLKVEDHYYYFQALFGTVLFKVHVHPELGIVYSIDMETNLKATAKPICWYELQLFQQKLKRENLSSVLGVNFDIITLLDYVYLSVEEIVNFHTEYNSLVRQYGTSHHFRMNSDFSVTVEVLSIDLIIFWIITIKLSPTRLVSKDDITAIAKLGEKVSEDHIKCIAENSPKGPNFLRNFLENLDEYVKRIERRIKMRRGHK